MPAPSQIAKSPAAIQFSLSALLELTAICGGIFAASGIVGTAASGLLAMMALMLMLRLGLAAIFMLAGAVMFSGDGFILAVFISSLVCLWFAVKRNWQARSRPPRAGRGGHSALCD